MAKFGELVGSKIPVLICFYAFEMNNEHLKEVSISLGDRAKVTRIDIHKNETLAEALRIKTTYTYMIYKDGEIKWRQSGEHSSEQLIEILNMYTDE